MKEKFIDEAANSPSPLWWRWCPCHSQQPHPLPAAEQSALFADEFHTASLNLKQNIVAIARFQIVFHIRQYFPSRRAAVKRRRVPSESINLLCQPDALYEVYQRAPVHFNDEIAKGKGRIEGGEERVCRSRG